MSEFHGCFMTLPSPFTNFYSVKVLPKMIFQNLRLTLKNMIYPSHFLPYVVLTPFYKVTIPIVFGLGNKHCTAAKRISMMINRHVYENKADLQT